MCLCERAQKSVQELLEYRYLIAVEGNDVPTGLKWMLASNRSAASDTLLSRASSARAPRLP